MAGGDADPWEFLHEFLWPAREQLGQEELTLERRPRVSVVVGPGVPLELPKVKNALVLLSLLGQFDRLAFEHVLKTRCGFEFDNEKEEISDPEYLQSRRLVLKVSQEKSDAVWNVDQFLALVSALENPPSVNFRRAVSKILSSAKAESKSFEIPIMLQVRLREKDHGQAFDPTMGLLLKLRDKHGGWRFPVNLGDELECRIVVDVMEVRVHSDDLPRDVAGEIEDLVSMSGGLTIPRLDVVMTIHGAWLQTGIENDTSRAGQFFERVICASDRKEGEFAFIDQFITCMDGFGPNFARMCTALAQCRTIRSVDVMIDPKLEHNTNLRSWEYLAYAFFSKTTRARSSLKQARFTGASMAPEYINAMAAVLGAKDPVRFLFERDNDELEARDENSAPLATMMLKSGASLILQPMYRGEEIPEESSAWTLKTNVSGVYVLGTASEPSNMLALVPGYGVCIVDEKYLLPVVEDLVFNTLQEENGITSLEIEFLEPIGENNERHLEAFPQFLEMVGASLTELNLSNLDESFQVSDVFLNCPKLKILSTRCANIIGSEFVEGYEDSESGIEEINCEFEDVLPIFQALSNENSLLAKNLSLLQIWSVVDGEILQRQEEVEALANMLRSNRKLEHIILTVDSSVSREVMDVVKPHQNEPLPIQRAPLPLQCRLAFLSVFSSTNNDKPDELKRVKPAKILPNKTLHRPDHPGLVSIFQFAADSVRRRIDITQG